jgi:hypothetical protein
MPDVAMAQAGEDFCFVACNMFQGKKMTDLKEQGLK